MLVSGNLLDTVNCKDIRLFLVEHPKEPEHRNLRLTLNDLPLHPDKGIHRTAGSGPHGSFDDVNTKDP